jgi:hypothetical protein
MRAEIQIKANPASVAELNLYSIWGNYKYVKYYSGSVHAIVSFSCLYLINNPYLTITLSSNYAHPHLTDKDTEGHWIYIMHIYLWTLDWQWKDTMKWKKISLSNKTISFLHFLLKKKYTHSTTCEKYYFEYIFIKLYIVIM